MCLHLDTEQLFCRKSPKPESRKCPSQVNLLGFERSPQEQLLVMYAIDKAIIIFNMLGWQTVTVFIVGILKNNC